MEQIGKIIGFKKYTSLKVYDLEDITEENLKAFKVQFPRLTVGEAIKLMKSYEEKYIPIESDKYQEKVRDYFEEINKHKKIREPKELTKDILWKEFSKNYRLNNNVKYSDSEESIENIKPLIYYFVGDLENFKSCKNVSNLSEPCLKKGLLIIGGYGNGKTSVMKSIEKSLRNSNVRYKTKSANEIVEKYEICKNEFDKKEFWNYVNNGTINFDDLLTEREASNYGKVNLFKDILEKRYDNNKRTYCTINYDDNFPFDLEKGLEQLAIKYGSRVYDRIFSMFNIIEFKGKSYRK